MYLTISRPLFEELIQRAADSPDAEICGLLLGRGADIEALLPSANVAADPRDSFEVDPAVLIAAHRAARDGAPAPIGHYHSHPRGRATPSARDAAAAERGSFWIIIAGAEVGCWLAGERGSFAPVAILPRDDGGLHNASSLAKRPLSVSRLRK